MNEQQLFIRFLKDKRIYSKFMRNFRKAEGEKITFKEFKEYCKQHDLIPKMFILCPFTWADTKEGHSFWLKVHAQWKDYYNTQILNK